MSVEKLAVLINGQRADQLAVLDRGLHYGDGIFETLLVEKGKPQLWEQHMSRLQCGSEAIGLPMVDPHLLHDEAMKLCGGSSRAVLKIILTRGSGGRGYRVPESVHMTRILSLHPYPEYPEAYWSEGVKVRLCNLRLARQPALAGVKHLNRLEQVLARQEWHQPDIVEGILRDSEDNVIEAVASNVFMVLEGELVTPDLTHCGVAGVMREHVMSTAEDARICTRSCVLSESDLVGADEVFLTNSLIGIWPVRQIDDRILPVGPVTKRLQKACLPHG